MSEKATLLTSIPPVAKSGSVQQSSTLLPAQSTSAPKQVKLNLLKPESSQALSAGAGDAVETVAEEPVTITTFQVVAYVSFVLSFCLAGFAAVVLFRKAAKIAEERFVKSVKILAVGLGLAALHGVFTTFLFSNHLNNPGVGAPLVFSMSLWVLLGPIVGVILNYLLTPAKTPATKDLAFDGGVFAVIFFCAMLGVSTSIKTNAALMFALLAGFLFIVPFARFLNLFKSAKVKHPELRETSHVVLVYALLAVPGLFALLGFLKVLRVLGDDSTLFLSNFIMIDFILVAGLSILTAANKMTSGENAEAVAEVKQSAAPASQAQPEAKAPAQRAVSPSSDPIIEFLNSEDSGAVANKPAASAPKKVVPRKPVKPGAGTAHPTPPKKPGSNPSSVPEAPNAPSRLKAPSKPKKRF